MTFDTSEGIFDPHQPFMQAPEQQGAEEYIPNSIIDFFEADVLADSNFRC